MPVRVEKEIIEVGRDVIVMRHIGVRPADRIVMQAAGPKPIQPAGQPPAGQCVDGVHLRHADRQQVAQCARLDAQRPVHIGLAQCEAGICKQPRRQRPVGQTDRHGRAAAGAETPGLAKGIEHGETTGSHEVAKRSGKQPHARPRRREAPASGSAPLMFISLIVRGFAIGHDRLLHPAILPKAASTAAVW